MDDVDLLILDAITSNARVSWVQLATALGLSRQTVAERVQRLEEAGVIKGYSAILSPEAVGADLTAFVAVTVEGAEQCQRFLEAVRALPEVQECHHIAGEDSYLLKVRTAGTRGLEALLTNQLKRLAGVTRTRSTIVLSTAKEVAAPPLRPGGGRGR